MVFRQVNMLPLGEPRFSGGTALALAAAGRRHAGDLGSLFLLEHKHGGGERQHTAVSVVASARSVVSIHWWSPKQTVRGEAGLPHVPKSYRCELKTAGAATKTYR